jgi:uncharacterized membrane protein YqjE
VAISPSISRLGLGTLQILRQRLELASIDVEEELLRLGLLLVASVVAALTACLALLFTASAIVIYYWDSARWSALLTICALFISLAAYIVWTLTKAFRDKPRFMAATLRELERDSAGGEKVQSG